MGSFDATSCLFGKPVMLLSREIIPASRSYGSMHKQDSLRRKGWYLWYKLYVINPQDFVTTILFSYLRMTTMPIFGLMHNSCNGDEI
jgi:hypothetical protein